MRIRKKKWAEPELQQCQFFIKNPAENKGKWNKAFCNNAPLYVELGCGKGTFAGELGSRNLNCNLLAIDIKIDMLGVAKRNIERIYTEKGIEVNNVLLVAYNIEQILDILDKNDKVERIYINFCNPWPKPKHKKRRLTYIKKLELYKEFLVPNGEIYFKTDDDELFRESLEYFKQAEYEILEKDYNYTNNNDIITEHQKMFEEQGIKTKFLRACLKTEINTKNYTKCIEIMQ